MPYVTKRVIKKVTHIGHIDQDTHNKAPTIDGPGFVVTNQPEAFRAARGVNGPEFELFCPNAEWYDPLEMDQTDVDEYIQWGLMMEYIEPCTAWGVDVFDENGDFLSKICATQEEAAKIAGRSLDEEIQASKNFEGATTELDHYRLRKRAIRKLGGWPDPLDWQNGLVLLYCREVILPKRPFYVGIWWEQPVDRSEKTAPYGVIFPECLARFSYENEDGDILPFAQAFPEYPLPKADEESGIEALARKMREEEKRLIAQGYDAKVAARMVAAQFLS